MHTEPACASGRCHYQLNWVWKLGCLNPCGLVPYQYALREWVWGSDSLWAHHTVHATWATCTMHIFNSPSSLLSSPQTHFLSLRVNVGCGPAEERVLLTGLHAVADIYCENCKTTLGWKYVSVLGWFDAQHHKLHPRLEDDKLGGSTPVIIAHPNFICTLIIFWASSSVRVSAVLQLWAAFIMR